MKKILIIIYILLLLVLIKQVATFVINEIFISKYEDEIYNEKDVESLFFLNIFEPYTAYYNRGNILYYNRDFDGAIEEYEEALELSPPEDKESDIETNLELAKKMRDQEGKDSEDQEEEEESEEEEKPKEDEKEIDKIEEQLKEIQKESSSEREDNLENMKRLDQGYEYYSGKKW